MNALLQERIEQARLEAIEDQESLLNEIIEIAEGVNETKERHYSQIALKLQDWRKESLIASNHELYVFLTELINTVFTLWNQQSRRNKEKRLKGNGK